MEHELKFRLFNGELMFYCSCDDGRTFIRLCPLTEEMKTVLECHRLHKWANTEEEKRHGEEDQLLDP